MKLPLSVTNGWPSGRIRCLISPLQPASAASTSIMLRVAPSPKRTTSTGSGNLPSVATCLEASAMTTMRPEAVATIFSMQQRAAAALDEAQLAVELVGAVDGEVEEGLLVERDQRECRAARPAPASPPRSARR